MSFKEAIKVLEDMIGDNVVRGKLRDAITKLLESAKKQVPVSPKMAYLKDYDGIDYVLTLCPTCGYEAKDKSTGDSLKRVYCVKCGQRFD